MVMEQLPPPLFLNPDWWESIFAVVLAICTLLGFIIRSSVMNPIKRDTELNAKMLEKIDKKTDAMAENLQNIVVQLEAVNSSVHSAHHRIDGVEDRVKRMEDVFFQNK